MSFSLAAPAPGALVSAAAPIVAGYGAPADKDNEHSTKDTHTQKHGRSHKKQKTNKHARRERDDHHSYKREHSARRYTVRDRCALSGTGQECEVCDAEIDVPAQRGRRVMRAMGMSAALTFALTHMYYRWKYRHCVCRTESVCEPQAVCVPTPPQPIVPICAPPQPLVSKPSRPRYSSYYTSQQSQQPNHNTYPSHYDMPRCRAYYARRHIK